jgi:uncharacterized protein (DUF58 family)
MLFFRPEGRGTDVGAALEYLSRVVRRKAVVFLLSDFVSADYTRPLRVANRRHDLVAIPITDPAEDDLPAVGLLHLTDAETGQSMLVDSSDRAVRETFAQERRGFRESRERVFRRYRVDTIDVRTDRPYADALVKFFRRREREKAA